MSLLASLSAIVLNVELVEGAYPLNFHTSKFATSAVRAFILSRTEIGLKSTMFNFVTRLSVMYLKLLSSSVTVRGYPFSPR